MSRINLIIPTVKVTCPDTWDDDQAEAVFESAEAALDAAFEAVAVKLRDVHPELDLYWSL